MSRIVGAYGTLPRKANGHHERTGGEFTFGNIWANLLLFPILIISGRAKCNALGGNTGIVVKGMQTDSSYQEKKHGKGSLRCWVIDDNQHDRWQACRVLRSCFPGAQVIEVKDPESFEEAMQMGEVDLVISDYSLGWSDGLALTGRIKGRYPDAIVIMLTGSGDEEVAVEGMKGGLDDYVVKTQQRTRLEVAIRVAFERREHKKAAIAAEHAYRELFTMVPIGLYCSTPGGEILDANPALAQLLGAQDVHDLVSRKAESFYPEIEERKKWQIALEASGGMYRIETKLIALDGQERWVLDQARVIEREGRVLYEGALVDLTARIQAEKELREKEEEYRAVTETARDGVMTFDESGRMFLVNPAASQLFGYTVEELKALTLKELMDPETADVQWERMRCNLQAFDPWLALFGLDFKGHRKNGALLELEVSIGEFQRSGIRVFTGIFRDISMRKQVEQRQIQMEKMESVGQLAGGVAHHFNNILTVIQSYAALVLADGRLPNDLTASVQQISDANQRAARIVNELVDFSQRERTEATQIQLNDEVQLVVDRIGRRLRPRCFIELELASNLPCVHVQPDMIERILLHLVLNAMEAQGEGWPVKITTELRRITEEYVRQHPESVPGWYVVLTVRDWGEGMNEATIQRVFEPFFTTKEVGRGLGLGLTTVYGLVRAHRGWIEIDSKLFHGTECHVFLPAVMEP